MGEKRGQGHPGPPSPSSELMRPQLAPGRGPSTLELGQALVAASLYPSHPTFSCGCRQLPAVAPTPALKARGLSNRGKNDLMRVGAGAGGTGPCNHRSAVGPARLRALPWLPAVSAPLGLCRGRGTGWRRGSLFKFQALWGPPAAFVP